MVCLCGFVFFFFFLFFFFQAEDGIRDTSVTGVQTCALPISHLLLPPVAAGLVMRYVKIRRRGAFDFPILGVALCVDRSEERRVGKECRSRRSPCHYKKKS